MTARGSTVPGQHSIAEILAVPAPGRVFLCVEKDWREAAAALVTDDLEFLWAQPDGLVAGDILVTVLLCDPALVACVERVVVIDDDGTRIVDRMVMTTPVPWRRVVRGMDPKPKLVTGALQDGAAVAAGILRGVDKPAREPMRVGSADSSPSALHVATVLAERDATWLRCAACDEALHPADAFAHTEQFGRRYLHEVVPDTHLICPPCHQLLDLPNLTALRHRLRPACPQCKVRDYVAPIQWGMPAGPPEDDEVVLGGCALPPVVPQWACRSCNVEFLVSTPDGPDRGLYFSATPPLVPVRRAERPCARSATWAGPWAGTARCPRSVSDSRTTPTTRTLP
ncbi:MAG: hypothetical protein NVV66_16435 [Cellulomonas sp.]|uniref:hypothetical protein n=1 Tax=Cellulomonas sp. TaxID=40001 RepID=UPI00258A4192|nr:hypothetical protein [Cellulomonas sp.]MCR6706203.1 hypothetical protein [Cellulomonas sp.]